jgi:hypothetical protein
MYRYFFRFVVASLTLLTANLVTNAINDYMVSYKYQVKPVTFTLIGMAIIIVVFYPLFMKLEDWLKYFSSKFVKTGKSIGGKYLGLFFTFVGGLLVLFYFYGKVWYHIDFLQVLWRGEIGKYF